MRLFLIGPNEGKTINLGGVHFESGSVEIPDDAGPAKNLLMNFHNAHPESALEMKDGKLTLKEVPEVETEETIPHSNHTIGANKKGAFEAPEAKEEVPELDEAGATKTPTPGARPAGRVRS